MCMYVCMYVFAYIRADAQVCSCRGLRLTLGIILAFSFSIKPRVLHMAGSGSQFVLRNSY